MALISKTPKATWLQDGGTPAIVKPLRTIVSVKAPMSKSPIGYGVLTVLKFKPKKIPC